MPMGRTSPWLPSAYWRWVGLDPQLLVLQRLETTSGGSALTSPLLNKLDVFGRVCLLRSPALPLLFCHHGDGRKLGRSVAQARCARWGSSAAVSSWSASSTAMCRPMVVMPSTLMAGRRLLRALTCAADLRIVCRRQLILYPPAGVPKGRLFCTRSAALFGCSVPSGVVPGDGAAGHDWWRRRDGGDSGPDCFSYFCCRVLFAKLEDLVVILCTVRVLHVTCTVTALT